MLPSFPRAVRVAAMFVLAGAGAVSPALAQGSAGTLVNLSSRIRVPDGGTPAIVGCAVSGSGQRTLLIRAVGPGLAPFGVTGTLGDPRLTVYDSNQRIIATNDNWDAGGAGATVAAAGAGVGAFGLTAGSRDAAALVTVPAGSYSIHVAGADAGGGVALIELYAVGSDGPRLVNLSVRGFAGTGADTLTVGFAGRGTPRTLLVRAVGPTLAAFGVGGTLADPQVRLFDGQQQRIAENRDWGRAADPAGLAAATTTVGAFALGAGSTDAAMIPLVNAGSYTVEVADERGGTGEALVEVYDVSAGDPYFSNRTSLLGNWGIAATAPPGPVVLTHAPMAPADLAEILPTGLMIFEHVTPTDHLYFWGQNRNAAPGTYSVFAPADGVITTIQHRVSLQGTDVSAREFNDYRMTFEHSGTFFSYYDLLDNVDPAIVAQIPGGIPRGGNVRVRVPVRGGQRVGGVGGKSLDFAVVDTQRPDRGFINPDFYLAEPWKVFTVDAFDAFVPGVRAQLLAVAPRTAAPRGGKIGYDLPGRLVGNWFREGTGGYSGNNNPRGYWVGHLSIAYHFIDAGSIIVSIGDYPGRGSAQFSVKGNAPLPENVSRTTGPVKYELGALNRIDGPRPLDGIPPTVFGTVLLEVLEGERLRMEVFPNRTAAQVSGFTAAAALYER